MIIDNPYRARGTLAEKSYIERDADTELRNTIKDNDRYPFFLAPRQSGKSSVMERARSLLSTEDLKIVIIDISLFSQKGLVDYNQFILNFVTLIYENLGVIDKLESYLQDLKKRPLFFIKSIKLLLQTIEGRIVVCIDELDAILTSDFKDIFLSQIRALFNERASDPLFKSIQFILAAAVSQDSLISDPNRSPFNVGERIILRDFNKSQVEKLVAVGNWLDTRYIEKASDRIIYWTNGSIFLSQNILERAYRRRNEITESRDICKLIDNVVDEIIVSAPDDIHFWNIQTQLKQQPHLLSMWEKWIDGKVPSMKEREGLLLAGISDERNPIRNKIYQGVFYWGGTLCLLSKADRSFEYDVFLSYNYKDKETVYVLAERLKMDGVRVWLDTWAIQPGDSIFQRIHQGLKRSRKILICMSPAYFDSMWGGVKQQTLLFHDPTNVQRRFIPLLIETCTMPSAFAQFAYIDWRTSSENEYGELLVACGGRRKKMEMSLMQKEQENLVHKREKADEQYQKDGEEVRKSLKYRVKYKELETDKKAKELSDFHNYSELDEVLNREIEDFKKYSGFIPISKKFHFLELIEETKNMDFVKKLEEIKELNNYILRNALFPRIELVHIADRVKENVRIATVQLNYSLSENFPYRIKDEEKEEIKEKVFNTISKAQEEEVDLLCFPELCNLEEWLPEIRKVCQKMIVIPGTSYDKENHNVCRLITDSDVEIPPQLKIFPSDFESSDIIRQKMVTGEKILNVYESQVGKFSILISRDFGNFSSYLKGIVDIILCPSYNAAIDRFYNIAHMHVTESPSYIIISNTAQYGGTSIFGRVSHHLLGTLQEHNFKEKGDTSYKLCQIDKGKEGLIIADFNLNYKSPQIPAPMNPEETIIPIKNIKKLIF